MCIYTEDRDTVYIQYNVRQKQEKSMQRYFSQPPSLKAAIFIGDEHKTQSQMKEQR